jgi:hypothetical protein
MSDFSRPKLLSLGVVLSCTAALGLPLGALSPASAGDDGAARPSIRVVQDPLFDVQQPAKANTDKYVAAPDRAIGDITRVRVRHGQHRLRLRIRAQELTRPRGDNYQVVFAGAHVRTPRDTFSAYLVLENDGGRRMLFARDGEEPRRCRGLRRDFDTDRGVFTASIPRRCLGQPRWVRAAATLAYSWPGGGDSDYYVDTAPDSDVFAAERSFSRRAWWPGS